MSKNNSAIVMIYNGKEADRNSVALILSLLKERGLLNDGDIVVKTFNQNDINNILLGAASKVKKVEIKVEEPIDPKTEALKYLGKIFKHMMNDLNDDVEQVAIYMSRRYARGMYNESDTVFVTAMDTITSVKCDTEHSLSRSEIDTLVGYGFDVSGFFMMLKQVNTIKMLLGK